MAGCRVSKSRSNSKGYVLIAGPAREVLSDGSYFNDVAEIGGGILHPCIRALLFFNPSDQGLDVVALTLESAWAIAAVHHMEHLTRAVSPR